MVEWLKKAVFYEIYPQSFQDTNSDGIGDLPGVIRRLDYIKTLGCNAIWLNPCFVSPFHDAGYDVADYCHVAPRYGTNDTMRELFEAAHQRGMHVILDLVPGHTSVDHPWFKASMKQEKNEYSGRYIWAPSPSESFTDVENLRGVLSGVSERGVCAVNFYSTQPALNYGFAKPDKPWQCPVDSPDALATREAMKDVMRFWLLMGCDGFRVDMAGSLVKGDADQEETISLWQEIREFLEKEFPEAAMISEWGNPIRAIRGGFHMDFLLHFGPSYYLDLFRENPYFSRKGKGDIFRFVQRYQESYEAAKQGGLICIPSGNHDMPRIARHLDEEELKIAFAFLLSMPGAPFIYYGDEIGMRYLEGIPSVEGGFERTGSRSPMQWDNGLNAGFSNGTADQLYIPLDPSDDRPTVKRQMESPKSLWREVQKLISIRQSNEPLQNAGDISFVYVKPGAYPFVYQRTGETGSVLVVLNPSEEEKCCTIDEQTPKDTIYFYRREAVLQDGKLTVPACSATFFAL